MNKYLLSYASILLSLVVLDYLWLVLIAQPMYMNGIGHLLASEPKLGFAACFYIVYAFGLMYFAVDSNESSLEKYRTFLTGALFGFVAYAFYDLTNLSLLKDWPLGLSIVDICWGTALSAVSAMVGKVVLDH